MHGPARPREPPPPPPPGSFLPSIGIFRSLYGLADAGHSLLIAAVVGSILVAINLGVGPLLRPWEYPEKGVQWALDYLTPFLVASLGAVLANRKTRARCRGPAPGPSDGPRGAAGRSTPSDLQPFERGYLGDPPPPPSRNP